MAASIGEILGRLGISITPTRPAPEPALPADPGCAPWCRGEGARRAPADPLPVLGDRVPTYLELMRAVRYDYCPCPAGGAARERHEQALATLEATATGRYVADLFDAAELPPKLKRYELDDYPDHAELVAKLRRWQPAARAYGANLLLCGDIGTFKTTLGAALVREHLADGGSALYIRARAFLARIRESYAPDAASDDKAATEWRLVRAAALPGLLLLDDVEEGLSEWARGILFHLLGERDLADRPTIITTNLSLDALEAALGKRTFDRFRGSCVDPTTREQFVCRLTGASRRGLAVVPPVDRGQGPA